jgi:hypothetical protein
VPAFRTVIAESYAWRPGHIEPKIRQWYRLDDDAPIAPWMRHEYLNKVAKLAAEQASPRVYGVAGKDTCLVFARDQESKRYLAAQFYSRGPRAGEFATAFEPTKEQRAAMELATHVGAGP